MLRTHPLRSLVLAVVLVAPLGSAGSAAARTGTWRWSRPAAVDPSGGGFTGVSCPSARLCVAVDQDGRVLASSDPRGGRHAWSAARIAGGADRTLAGVSCPTARLCVTAAGDGDAYVSTNPMGHASAWRAIRLAAGRMTSVSCPSSRLCVASAGAGGLVVTTDPTGGANAWRPMTLATEPDFQCEKEYMEQCPGGVASVTCPSARICVAVDGEGLVLWSTDPAGGADAWRSADVDPQARYLGTSAVSCPSASLCLFGDGERRVYTSRNPGGGRWTAGGRVRFAFQPLLCPLTTLCLAVDEIEHRNWLSAGAAAGRADWRRLTADATPVTGIACPSATECVAVDGAGRAMIGRPVRAG